MGITDQGMLADMRAQLSAQSRNGEESAAAAAQKVPPLSSRMYAVVAATAANAMGWLYETPLEGVVRTALACVRFGAPSGLVPITLLPVRVLGAAQQMAPDWMTALLLSGRLPGNPWSSERSAKNAAAAAAAESKREKQRAPNALAKEE
jgi:hypothetical protein